MTRVKTSSRPVELRGFVRPRIPFGSFSRSFALADEVSSEEIDAKYDNGVLNVLLPKRPAAKRREIAVKANA